jgi:hypothetical protein
MLLLLNHTPPPYRRTPRKRYEERWFSHLVSSLRVARGTLSSLPVFSTRPPRFARSSFATGQQLWNCSASWKKPCRTATEHSVLMPTTSRSVSQFFFHRSSTHHPQ